MSNASWDDYQSASHNLLHGLFGRLRAHVGREIVAEEGSCATLFTQPAGTPLGFDRVGANKGGKGADFGACLQPGWEDDFAFRNFVSAPENGVLVRGLLETIESDSRVRITHAKLRWKSRSAELRNQIAHLGLQKSHFARRVRAVLDSAVMREALFGKRLEYQSRNATRRLQELIYECVGEYDKTHRRALGRAGFLDSDSENQVRQVMDALQWTRFAERLTEDWLRLVQADYVDPQAFADAFRRYSTCATRVLESRLPPHTSARIKTIIQLNPGPGAGRKRVVPSSTLSASCTPVCSDVASLTGVLWKAAERVDRRLRRHPPQLSFHDGPSSPQPCHTAPVDTLPLTTRATSGSPSVVRTVTHETLLSCAGIRWLLASEDRFTGSCSPEPLTCRVYYCLEERARYNRGNLRMAREKEKADALARYLEAVYVDAASVPSKDALGKLGRSCARTVRLLPTCQRLHNHATRSFPGDLSMLEGYPDVLEAELSDGSCPPLRVHMACASVLQLLESQAFAHMLDSLSPELQHDLQDYHNVGETSPPIITHLFLALPGASPPDDSSSNALLSSLLLPLSQRAIHELLHLYLLEPPPRVLASLDPLTLESVASAMTVFPPLLPTRQSVEPAKLLPHKYVVIFDPLAGDEAESTRPAHKSHNTTCQHQPFQQAVAVLVEFDQVDRANDQEQQHGHDKHVLAGVGSGGEEEEGTKKAGKKSAVRWDPTIVGPYCRWRGCLETAGDRNVCQYHGEVRRFLDARAGAMAGTGKAKGKEKVQSEAARYLLRKPLAIEGTGRRGLHMEADMKALVHSSSLLEELLTGKLGETVRSFCRRAAMESGDKFQASQRQGLRRQLPQHRSRGRRRKADDRAEGTSGDMVEVPWSRWRSWDELKGRTQALESEIEVAYKVRKVERAISSELQQLVSLGVSPQADLMVWQREVEEVVQRRRRGLGDEDCEEELCSDRGRMSTDPLADDADRTLELQWAERKHQLLRQRRLREASEDHGTTKRDDVLVLPPAGTRFDAPVRPFQAIPPPHPGPYYVGSQSQPPAGGPRLDPPRRSLGPQQRRNPYAQSIDGTRLARLARLGR